MSWKSVRPASDSPSRYCSCLLYTSIGKVAGREAVQLYVKAPNGGLDKPAKELKAFGKTALLQPGKSQTLILTWNVMDMASFNEKNSSWELAKRCV